jgi:hypothetical protein
LFTRREVRDRSRLDEREAAKGGGGTFDFDQMLQRDKSKDTGQKIVGWSLVGVGVVLVVPVAASLDPSKRWGADGRGQVPALWRTNLAGTADHTQRHPR